MKSKTLLPLIILLNFQLNAQILSDTTIHKKHYLWVKYDLNKNPYEIGQDYSNGIKNGRWIYRDQQGRVTQVVQYKNDTLLGCAEYYEYLNDPIATKYVGLLINGVKIGEWSYSIKKNRKSSLSRWKKYAILTYDLSGKLVSRCLLNKNGSKKFEAFYDEQGEENYWKFYNKFGKLTQETGEYPYKTILI